MVPGGLSAQPLVWPPVHVPPASVKVDVLIMCRSLIMSLVQCLFILKRCLFMAGSLDVKPLKKVQPSILLFNL